MPTPKTPPTADRRRKFTPEVQATLVRAAAAGVSQADAAVTAGVKLTTLRRWLRKGRDGKAGYAEFAVAYDAAYAQAQERPAPMDEAELLAVVSNAARNGSVQAMKLRWEQILVERRAREGDSEERPDPLDEVDELAARRTATPRS